MCFEQDRLDRIDASVGSRPTTPHGFRAGLRRVVEECEAAAGAGHVCEGRDGDTAFSAGSRPSRARIRQSLLMTLFRCGQGRCGAGNAARSGSPSAAP